MNTLAHSSALWSANLVGRYCSQCLLRVREVSDLVGPVMTL
jgi:hypothetical protein